MKILTSIFLIIVLCLPLYAAELNYESALAKSKQDESSLNSSLMQSLLEVQGNLIGKAFMSCIRKTGMAPHDFTLVMRLNKTGEISKTWLKKRTKFTSCFTSLMETNFKFSSDRDEFYTAIEYEQ